MLTQYEILLYDTLHKGDTTICARMLYLKPYSLR